MAVEQAQEVAAQAKGRASRQVREQLDTHSTQLGEQATSFGRALRRAAEELDSEGSSAGANAAHRAADEVERLAGYLTGSSSDRFLGDLERFGRERPWAAGGVGLLLGFVGARFVKASSESRYESTYRTRYDADLPLSRDEEATELLPPPELPPYGSV